MKRVLRLLIRIYPAWWRRRYEKELAALLEDSGSGWPDVGDLFRGAMQMQMKTWSFGRIVMVCGIAGVLLAGVLVFSFPLPYSSEAILKIPAGGQPLAIVNEAAQAALTRSSLTRIINDRDLYLGERKTMPLEDVIDKVMRPAIRISPAGPGLAAVRFAYQDPSIAQQVVQTLAERFAGFEVLDPPSAPERVGVRKRFGLAGLGMPAGLLFGVVLALILRRRSVATS